eukprot:scaffold10571_cov154-Cylindrotheca_fusiformis.AAC.10
MAKKYKLFSSSTSNGGKQVCAFFSSPDGCRNGAKCPFVHGSAGKAAEVSETASVISSESEDSSNSQKEDDAIFSTPPPRKPSKQDGTDNSKKSRKKKRKSGQDKDDDFLFANPKVRPESDFKKTVKETSNKKQKCGVEDRSVPKENSPSSPDASFRRLVSNLPVATFSVTESGGENSRKAQANSSPSRQVETTTVPQTSNVGKRLPLPVSTETGRKWVKAVQKTREHDRYKSSFDFSKYKQLDQNNGIQSTWIKAKPYGSWCQSNPQAIAIDCEMCETQDPLSGVKNPKALCRVSVVNAEKPEEVLLDTLVKPAWPVTDYRTRINGIKKENLDNVEFTLRHAQAFMIALCSEETVILGHAVQNDLAALNMEHHCNADSSFLFHAKDSESATVSLKDLVFGIFQKKMPETHDSVNDARKALDCVLHWVENDGKVAQIERSTNNSKAKELFVHRIPKQCKPQNLSSMFQKHTDIQPTSIADIEFSGESGKTHVVFRTPRHAKLAFDTLDGTAEPDKSGRLQKKVYLRNGDYVRIRKMVFENNRSSISNPNKT